jgi:hypothetical protein
MMFEVFGRLTGRGSANFWKVAIFSKLGHLSERRSAGFRKVHL